MISLILFLSIFIAFTAWGIRKRKANIKLNSKLERHTAGASLALGLFGFTLALAVTTVFLLILGSMGERVITDTETIKVTNFSDGLGENGSFTFGSGSVDSQLTFSWYQEDSQGIITPHSVTDDEKNDIQIKQLDENQTAYIQKDTTAELVDKDLITFFPIQKKNTWTFYVPKGSVKEDVVLDAQ